MEIKVLGIGCEKCQKLDEIMKLGVMITPGLLIDGELQPDQIIEALK